MGVFFQNTFFLINVLPNGWVWPPHVYFMSDIVILKYCDYSKYMIILKYFAQRVKDNMFLPIGRSFNFIIKTEICSTYMQYIVLM